MTFEMTPKEWEAFHAALLDAKDVCEKYEAENGDAVKVPYSPLIKRVTTQIGTYAFC